MGDSFSNKWCLNNCLSTYRRIKLNPYLTLYTRINSKWIKDLNVKMKTIKPLQNIGINLCDLGFGNGSLDDTQSTSNNKNIGKSHITVIPLRLNSLARNSNCRKTGADDIPNTRQQSWPAQTGTVSPARGPATCPGMYVLCELPTHTALHLVASLKDLQENSTLENSPSNCSLVTPQLQRKYSVCIRHTWP